MTARIVRRSEETLGSLSELIPKLRDPDSEVPQQPEYAKNEYRSIKPEYLILVGICTHLGCSPTYVKVTDAHSLTIRLTEPFAPFLWNLAAIAIVPGPPAHWRAVRETGSTRSASAEATGTERGAVHVIEQPGEGHVSG